MIRVLDGLTADQIDTVKRLYEDAGGDDARERPLRARAVRLRREPQARPDGPDQVAAQGHRRNAEARLEAVAIELHELLGGSRRRGQARARDGALPPVRSPRSRPSSRTTSSATGTAAHMDLVLKLPGVHLSRVMALRAGNSALADAYAIEDKRRALDDLEAKKDSGGPDHLRGDGLRGKAPAPDRRDHRHRRREPQRRPAQEDPGDAGLEACEHARRPARRHAQGDRGGGHRRRDRRSSWRSPPGGSLEMEARDTTSSAKIRDLHRGALREGRAVHVDEFIATYDRLKPADGRTWAQIVASADPENEEMLNALTAGGGRLSPVDELRFAIRKKDAAPRSTQCCASRARARTSSASRRPTTRSSSPSCARPCSGSLARTARRVVDPGRRPRARRGADRGVPQRAGAEGARRRGGGRLDRHRRGARGQRHEGQQRHRRVAARARGRRPRRSG